MQFLRKKEKPKSRNIAQQNLVSDYEQNKNLEQLNKDYYWSYN